MALQAARALGRKMADVRSLWLRAPGECSDVLGPRQHSTALQAARAQGFGHSAHRIPPAWTNTRSACHLGYVQWQWTLVEDWSVDRLVDKVPR